MALFDQPLAKVLLDAADKLVALSDSQLRKVSEIKGKPADAGFQLLAHSVLEYVRELLSASLTLLRAKPSHVRPAMNLWRSIFEACITVTYVRKNPDERVRLYWGYYRVKRLKLFEALQAHTHLDDKFKKRRTQAEHDLFKKEADTAKTDYPKADKWAGVSLGAMARDVGAQSFYEFEYSYLCDEVHMGAAALAQRLEEDPAKGIILKAGDEPEHSIPTFHRVMEWSLHVAQVHADAFALSEAGDLVKLRDEMNAEGAKVAAQQP